MFDVQVKRIHEYKRQHLNILHVVAHYVRLKSGLAADAPPRTFVFGGKAAPGYYLAKLIIKLINSVGEVLERDPDARERMRVVFVPNYNVSSGQRVYPTADLSEQISTAGKEASGTGNMKFSLNGALTIGTLDGANIEIREEVGAENFFLFGLTAQEVADVKAHGYRPRDYYLADPELREVIDLIRSGFFSRGDAELFRPLVDNLLHSDPYLVLADFRAYVDCQQRVSAAYCNRERVGAHVHPQLRTQRKILLRPHHPRVLPRHLARASRPRRAADAGRRQGGIPAVTTDTARLRRGRVPVTAASAVRKVS